mgnify:CR=1 FL=1|tara:strand:+ start:13 stop:375 length:363 start_codon:yes stop_codon:yes gene_type:complete
MKWYVLENEDKRKYLSSRVSEDILYEKGWGNGYVAVSPTHPLHLGNITQIKISLVQSLNVNGGITYNDYGDGKYAPKDWWVFGFDTSHFGDTIEKWPKEAVEAETMSLFWQLIELDWGGL